MRWIATLAACALLGGPARAAYLTDKAIEAAATKAVEGLDPAKGLGDGIATEHLVEGPRLDDGRGEASLIRKHKKRNDHRDAGASSGWPGEYAERGDGKRGRGDESVARGPVEEQCCGGRERDRCHQAIASIG